jgi:hypothetical protein
MRDGVNGDQKCSKGELENNSRKPRDLTENRHNDSLKRVILLFLRVGRGREMIMLLMMMMMQ